MPTYELVQVTPMSGELVKRTDEDGTVWWIPTDPANSDYAAYLASLEA